MSVAPLRQGGCLANLFQLVKHELDRHVTSLRFLHHTLGISVRRRWPLLLCCLHFCWVCGCRSSAHACCLLLAVTAAYTALPAVP